MKTLQCRVTDIEYELIANNAQRAGLNISDYIRHCIFSNPLSVTYNITAGSDILIDKLPHLIAEFGRTGNNLNQIAKHFNLGGLYSKSVREQIGRSLGKLQHLEDELNYLLETCHGDTKTYSIKKR